MRTEVKTITPEQAQYILDNHNKGNRKPSQANVNALAAEMIKGRWMLNGQGISFDVYGELNDGQHRLMACVQSDVPLKTLVIYGVEEGAFKCTDVISRPRTTGDILGIEGVKSRNDVASIAKIVMEYEARPENQKHKTFTTRTVSKTDVAEFALKRGDFDEAARLSKRLRNVAPQPTLICACFYICSKIDADDARTFFLAVVDLEKAMKVPQSFFLRDKLKTINLTMKGASSGRTRKPIEIMALVFKAWNYFRDGRTLKKLQWKADSQTNERFPIPR